MMQIIAYNRRLPVESMSRSIFYIYGQIYRMYCIFKNFLDNFLKNICFLSDKSSKKIPALLNTAQVL